MRIVLVNPPSRTYRSPEEHLGLSYLKSILLSDGHEVDILDGYLFRLDNDMIIEAIAADHLCKFVGVSPYIDSLENSLVITESIKRQRPDIHICWGGHLATSSAIELLEKHSSIDSIIRGEGELTCQELAAVLSSGGKINPDIKGLAMHSSQGIILTPPRDLIKNLDCLPFPDRYGSDESYRRGSLVQISGGRGCYGDCSFCSINSIFRLANGQAWRGRSPQNIVSELVELHQKYGYDSFKFVDDSFFGPGKNWEKRGLEIADRIIQSEIKIRFRISVRANNVSEQVFRKLKEAGLYAVSIGIESGVQRMLDTFNKQITVPLNFEALKVLQKLDIIVLMGYIGFDPYVTLEEIFQNIDFLERNDKALTDMLSKPLYVHADDAITKKLINEGLITGRKFPNYQYKIVDWRAAMVLRLIETWDQSHQKLYNKVFEPLTAPRRTTPEQERRLLPLCLQLKKIDLGVFKAIAKQVGLGRSELLIGEFLASEMTRCLPLWIQVEKLFSKIGIT